ncbi:CPXCG motif-containing cysteine-rich protein [Parahalioglobus pacificus]|uniref:CPXCG motif-containing cysteine-rich protein n=1 Tax=Parahalioglobus pacificus TaxID=930806 RepID=A0A918XLF2_9GAMM|nr:CPXCG motif-containing cysteine-rich protein [Halioglobus pacificus]GHD37468.1 hypothetical protein GCM10007053_27080 [Halioglobus pacificus]
MICPYCWESIDVLIDPGDLGESYIEDCQVCCQPIEFSVSEGLDGEVVISITQEGV